MFPPTTTQHPNKRSFRELLRAAVETVVEFATLGEAYASAPSPATEPPPAVADHPHRRVLRRRPPVRRPGAAALRVQHCTVSKAASAARRPRPVVHR